MRFVYSDVARGAAAVLLRPPPLPGARRSAGAPRACAQAPGRRPPRIRRARGDCHHAEDTVHACGVPPAARRVHLGARVCSQQGNSQTSRPRPTSIRQAAGRAPSGIFRPWDEAAEETALRDFRTLMFDTNFLEDMTIEVTDHTFPNGVVGKMVVYKMEERERVKIVDYQDGDGKSISIVKRSDIDEKLREKNIEIRLDSFLDEAAVRRVKAVVRDLMAERLHHATLTTRGRRWRGQAVTSRFTASQGPRSRSARCDFLVTRRSATAICSARERNNPQASVVIPASHLQRGGVRKTRPVVDYYRNRVRQCAVASPRSGHGDTKMARRSGSSCAPGDRGPR